MSIPFHAFPTDVIADIVADLDGYCIAKLYLCGNARLNRSLESPRVVRSFRFEFSLLCIPSFPTVACRFTTLEELSISAGDRWLFPPPFAINLALLPKGLKSLNLDFTGAWDGIHLLKAPTSSNFLEPIDFSCFFPALEYVFIADMAPLNPLIKTSLFLPPPTLTKLVSDHQFRIEHIKTFPETVTDLTFTRWNQDGDFTEDVVFPRGLLKLFVSNVMTTAVLSILPHHLEELTVHYVSCHDVETPETFANLPRTLKSLSLRKYAISSCIAQCLPPQLTLLSLATMRECISVDDLQLLPRSLTSLGATFKVPDQATCPNFPTLLARLPPNLTSLPVMVGNWLDEPENWLQLLSPSITVLYLSNLNPNLPSRLAFPSSLTNLTLDVTIPADCDFILPMTLTTLTSTTSVSHKLLEAIKTLHRLMTVELRSIDSHLVVFPLLPPSVTRITLGMPYIDVIQPLPVLLPSLTSLRMTRLTKPPSAVFIASLPSLLTELRFTVVPSSTPWDAKSILLPWAWKHLHRLESLDLSMLGAITDEDLLCIPRRVTSLQLEGNANAVTPQGMENLPKCLWHLRLPFAPTIKLMGEIHSKSARGNSTYPFLF